MLIYRDAPGAPVATVQCCRELTARARSLAASTTPFPDPAFTLATDLGMFEAAVCDALNGGDVEHVHATGLTLRDAAIAAADACLGALAGDLNRLRMSAGAVAAALARLDLSLVPERLSLRTPEGFAYYGLYPETYADAVEPFACEQQARRAVCVGVRSIGTTLSAFVVAALRAHGCAVSTWTVRPAGHPFDRRVRLGDDVARLLGRPQPDVAFVADEGPGLSGSSFAATADALCELGIPREHIVLLPAWLPDGSAFRSERAAETWRAHRKAHVSFERAWIENGRLASTFGATSLEDISAGRWRNIFHRRGPQIVVQPQHERRKYLALLTDRKKGRQLLKFAGLGRFGAATLARAERLEGLPVARPSRLLRGFHQRDVVEGRPLTPRDADPKFLGTAAHYLASVAERFRQDTAADRETIATMLEVNVREAFTDSPLARLGPLVGSARTVPDAPAVLLDARMLPHEWLRTRTGWVKVDALEHHDDHFFPGPQDVAWDVAATIVEFELEQAAADRFTEGVARRLRDAHLASRIPFYTSAYLAFRTGYCTVGSEAVQDPDDREKLTAAAARYRSRLRALVE